LGISQQKRAYDAKAQQSIEDGTYSEQNYQYGLYKAGWGDYMSDKTQDIGALSYTPQQNVSATYIEQCDNMDAVTEGITKKVVSKEKPNYFVSKKQKGLTRDKIRTIVYNTLTADQREQLEINAWAANGGKDPSEAYGQIVAEK